MLDEATCAKLARHLDEARRGRRELEPLHKTFGELDLRDAYCIQRLHPRVEPEIAFVTPAGAAAPAEPVRAGHTIRLEVSGLTPVTLRCT